MTLGALSYCRSPWFRNSRKKGESVGRSGIRDRNEDVASGATKAAKGLEHPICAVEVLKGLEHANDREASAQIFGKFSD